MNIIEFPQFTGIKCNMMPFIQGDAASLPEIYKPYADIIKENFISKGDIGFLTIDEAFVEGGKSQRGYGKAARNVHIEVGRNLVGWHWGNPWGGSPITLLADDTEVLIANSISDTCRVWDAKAMSVQTADGDLSDYVQDFPAETGRLLKAGQVERMSIFTPHECVPQRHSGNRQFFRIVGKGVRGREDYFTINPLMLNKFTHTH